MFRTQIQGVFLCVFIVVLSDAFHIGERAVRATSWPCPMASEVLPCTCTSDAKYNLNINCSLVASESELTNAMNEVFPFDDCNNFLIDDPDNENDIGNLTIVTFGGKTFDTITISGTKLEHISDDAFSHMNALMELNLPNNYISLFPFQTLINFEQLLKLDLRNNRLAPLPPIVSNSITDLYFSGNPNLDIGNIEVADTFTGLTALAELRLSSINLSLLGYNMFKSNSNLKELYLNNNDLTKLEPSAINPTNGAITTLHLNDNQINDVMSGSITGLGTDCELNMMNNEIMELNADRWQAIFDQIPNGIIMLGGNPLLCGCDMKWIALDAAYLNLISLDTTCESGDKNIHDLDNGFFNALCDDEAYNTKGLSYSQLVALKEFIDRNDSA